jgi:cell wall-associated NlpC family hydrolase
MTGMYIVCKFTVIDRPYLINFKTEPGNMATKIILLVTSLQFFSGCFEKHSREDPALLALEKDSLKTTDSVIRKAPADAVIVRDTLPSIEVKTTGVSPDNIVAYAKTLLGTPYLYASTDPVKGFDCSGFITYVFNHFNIKVPRSSIDFTHVGKEIPVNESKTGDLILFTGTDSTERFVGHMGIIVSNAAGEIQFIHSSSGKAHGVTITPLNPYYKGRFMKVIRIFDTSS